MEAGVCQWGAVTEATRSYCRCGEGTTVSQMDNRLFGAPFRVLFRF